MVICLGDMCGDMCSDMPHGHVFVHLGHPAHVSLHGMPWPAESNVRHTSACKRVMYARSCRHVCVWDRYFPLGHGGYCGRRCGMPGPDDGTPRTHRIARTHARNHARTHARTHARGTQDDSCSRLPCSDCRMRPWAAWGPCSAPCARTKWP